jgi:glycosyltransferase involved in cell wall biosynthesis
MPLLRDLCDGTEVRFLAVGAGVGAGQDQFGGMELRDWSEDSEVASVQDMDIGIMPMLDEPWAHGKSGYKLIQYMACGLPVVATPVGVNATIVSEGTDGLLARSADEWRSALNRLVSDVGMRRTMGTAGRRRVVEGYSLQSQAPRLIELFRSLAPC